jgi:trimethylamine:corrinoid methyltransferase-like protein
MRRKAAMSFVLKAKNDREQIRIAGKPISFPETEVI